MSDTPIDPLAALDAAVQAAPKPKTTRTKSKSSSGKKTDSASTATPAASKSSPAGAAARQSDDALVVPELPHWTADSYKDFLTGSGARKLADSGVAPLVAAARGYSRVVEDNFKETMKAAGIDARSGQHKTLAKEMVANGGDGMVMPWYAITDVAQAYGNAVDPQPVTYQLRPHRPVKSSNPKDIDAKTGERRTMKYVLPSGSVSPLDLHPSVPASWIDTTPVVMFTEGLLKGDAAMSGWLRHMGATWEELADTSAGARGRLSALMERLAAERAEDDSADYRPIMIITIVGVFNTSQNPSDWREVNLRDREGWIAFDADVAKNPNVWMAAHRLWETLSGKVCRMSEVKVLNPVAVAGEDAALMKMGVDDFLAQAGEWPQLIAYLQDSLPTAPERNEDEVEGNWRVTKDGRSTEECLAQQDGTGVKTGVAWVPRIPLGGRILSSEVRRRPTALELATGRFGAGVDREDYEEVRARVEVSWERHGVESTVVVDGPERYLNYGPEQWDRHGADIPTELLQHPAWPPAGKDGSKWMSAIKANQDDQITRSTRWTQMGWVPVEGHNPAFVVGGQVVGDEDMPADAVVPGVTEESLEVAGHYGVSQTALEVDWNEPEHKAAIREDLGALITTYVKNHPWVNPGHAAVVLTVGLRPVIPIRPRATAYLAGSKGSGKSWTAERMMSFWECEGERGRPNAFWIDGTLPGSAKDTIAFVENAVAKTPIWVVDDLAPSSSARQSESENAKLEDLTRNIFNNASKGRMNADMTTRRSNAPMAQLVITAENDLQVASVRERLVPVRFQAGASLGHRDITDAAVQLHRDGIPSRVTAHLLKFVRMLASRHVDGWEGWMTTQRASMATLEAMIVDGIESAHAGDDSQQSRAGALRRAGILAADLAIVLHLLTSLADYAGLDPELTALLGEDKLQADLVELISSAHTENADAAPGRSITESLKDLMQSGRAHVIDPENPGSPPARTRTGDADYDSRSGGLLGWVPDHEGVLRPSGIRIGEVFRKSRTGEDVVAFYDQVAFNEAARAFPNRIPPGSRAYQIWCGVWDEKLVPKGETQLQDGSKPRVWKQFQFSTSAGSKQRISVRGVPVRLSLLLGEEDNFGSVEDVDSSTGQEPAAEQQ